MGFRVDAVIQGRGKTGTEATINWCSDASPLEVVGAVAAALSGAGPDLLESGTDIGHDIVRIEITAVKPQVTVKAWVTAHVDE